MQSFLYVHTFHILVQTVTARKDAILSYLCFPAHSLTLRTWPKKSLLSRNKPVQKASLHRERELINLHVPLSHRYPQRTPTWSRTPSSSKDHCSPSSFSASTSPLLSPSSSLDSQRFPFPSRSTIPQSCLRVLFLSLSTSPECQLLPSPTGPSCSHPRLVFKLPTSQLTYSPLPAAAQAPPGRRWGTNPGRKTSYWQAQRKAQRK